MNDEKDLTQDANLKKDLEDTLEEDVVFEDNTEVTGADYQQKVTQLKQKIKELETKAQEYLTGWQKDKADFINLRKKDEESKKFLGDVIKQDMIEKLLPVLDSFELAMKNKEAWEKVESNWRMGVEYIHNQLYSTLENQGLVKVYPLGQEFDPTRDEAIEIVPVSDKAEDGKVIEVVQTGYKVGQVDIRPPKVKVGEYKE
jgi:molecular chaperone GrpE